MIEDAPRVRSSAAGQAFSRQVGELVDGIARASEEDLTRLYDLTAKRVFGLALRILRNEADAQEVTLDVYTRIWRRAAVYDSARGSAWTLMVLMTRNLAIDRMRSRRPHAMAAGTEELLSELEWTGDSPEGQLEASETRERILKVFQGLPEEQREVLSLAFFEGLTHAEAAEKLGEPLGTVKTRIRSGLARLRRAFLGEEGRSAATQ